MEASSLIESAAALPFPSSTTSMIRAVELGTLPSLGMGVATLCGLHVFQTPPAVVGALQHFSAGILLATLGKELLPEMVQAQGLAENAASGLGFFAGVGFLVVLGILLPEQEKADDDASSSTLMASPAPADIDTTLTNDRRPPVKEKVTRLRNRQQSKRREAFALAGAIVAKGPGLGKQHVAFVSVADDTMNDKAPPLPQDDSMTTTIEKTSRWEKILATLPIAFLTAICIDAALDGLLIGISTAVDPTTGPILAASMTVESTFFGITISTALRGREIASGVLLGAAALGPASLLTGSLAGGALAPTLVDSPVLLAGLLGFGTSTILFMVAEELLLEAHEEGGEHIWWVDFQLYTGFFASIMVEKLAGV
jgi:zinc transporter ZupT